MRGNKAKNKLHGFAIVTAIFILVVLAALGAFILNVFTNQQIGSALDVQGVRAYQAARAGIEWGLFKVQSSQKYNFSYGDGTEVTPAVGAVDPSVTPVSKVPSRVCPAPSTSFVPTTAPTLSGFTVTVTCQALTDAASGPTVFKITATACNQPAAGSCPNTSSTTPPNSFYVERMLEVVF
jgi:MSHA biogenesis protein MshP